MEMLAWKEPFATISIVYISACRSFGETIQMKAKVILGIVKKKQAIFPNYCTRIGPSSVKFLNREMWSYNMAKCFLQTYGPNFNIRYCDISFLSIKVHVYIIHKYCNSKATLFTSPLLK